MTTPGVFADSVLSKLDVVMLDGAAYVNVEKCKIVICELLSSCLAKEAETAQQKLSGMGERVAEEAYAIRRIEEADTNHVTPLDESHIMRAFQKIMLGKGGETMKTIITDQAVAQLHKVRSALLAMIPIVERARPRLSFRMARDEEAAKKNIAIASRLQAAEDALRKAANSIEEAITWSLPSRELLDMADA